MSHKPDSILLCAEMSVSWANEIVEAVWAQKIQLPVTVQVGSSAKVILRQPYRTEDGYTVEITWFPKQEV